MSRATGFPCDTSTLGPAGASSLRSKIKGVRLTDAELQDICTAARACNMPPSVFMRSVVLGKKIDSKPPVPQINAQAYTQLGKVGGNLNQIALKLNSGKEPDENLAAALSQLAGVLKSIRGQLLGAGS